MSSDVVKLIESTLSVYPAKMLRSVNIVDILIETEVANKVILLLEAKRIVFRLVVTC